LNHRKWKKKLAWWLYAKRDLLGATLIHATAEMEAGFIRDALGEKCPPIIVVPNGVELPDEDCDGRDEADKGGLKRILFLSRIHPKKGVLDLIKAFGDLKPEGWELVIAGNDDGGHRAVCEDFASHQVNADRITFTGPVSDADKWEVYRSADLFVLPSYSENFGIVIGEALGMGVPVITTTATPWERMEEKGCGWWIEPGEDSLKLALKKALALDPETRAAMGKRGSAWIRSEFTWESVGRQFVDAVRGHGLLQDPSMNSARPR
ncbi:MAG: glycosyltransferase, partial [Opitutales bacterium]